MQRLQKAFTKEAELDDKGFCLAEVNAELNMDRRVKKIFDGKRGQGEYEHVENIRIRSDRNII